MMIPCLCLFLFIAPRSSSTELPINKKRTQTPFIKNRVQVRTVWWARVDSRAALLKTAHWAVFALSSATAPMLFKSTLGCAL